jgi:hypothetical protein
MLYSHLRVIDSNGGEKDYPNFLVEQSLKYKENSKCPNQMLAASKFYSLVL